MAPAFGMLCMSAKYLFDLNLFARKLVTQSSQNRYLASPCAKYQLFAALQDNPFTSRHPRLDLSMLASGIRL